MPLMSNFSSSTRVACSQAIVLYAPTADDMDLLASSIVTACPPTTGDCYAMYGSVGAGKSTFVRSFIRAAMQEPHLIVPSPTFLLQNVYEVRSDPPVSIIHMDLYRLKSMVREVQRLGIDALDKHVALVEWPELLDSVSMMPKERMDVLIEVLPSTQVISSSLTVEEDERIRKVTFTPHGERWELRLSALMKELKGDR
jgi:tRNA threonylcarbamoyl adenosine modification protein YjeE